MQWALVIIILGSGGNAGAMSTSAVHSLPFETEGLCLAALDQLTEEWPKNIRFRGLGYTLTCVRVAESPHQ